MSGIKLSQRLWLLADNTAQRALDGFANVYDDTAKKLNNAFDFSDASLTIRQPVTAPALATVGGFKAVIGPWQKSSSTLPTAPTALAWGIDSAAATASNLIQGFIATHPGSIIGMQLAGLSSPASAVTVTVYKNQVATAASLTAQLGISALGTSTTFAKGAVTFAANDRLEIYFFSATSNCTGQLVSSFTVEMSA